MRTGISITLAPTDQLRLEAIVGNRNTAQKHVWRAAIVLLSAEGVGTSEIMRRTGTSKTCVWRWQERFMQEGVDGLLRDKTRPSRIKPLEPALIERVVSRTLADPPGEVTPRRRASVSVWASSAAVPAMVSDTSVAASGAGMPCRTAESVYASANSAQ